MGNIVFEFEGINKIQKDSLVGSKKFKDVEISFKLAREDKCSVIVNSEVNTDGDLWKDLLDRFFLVNDIHADIEVNDFGAKPSTITFRLNQALELASE